jgi:DNA replication protein DnaC
MGATFMSINRSSQQPEPTPRTVGDLLAETLQRLGLPGDPTPDPSVYREADHERTQLRHDEAEAYHQRHTPARFRSANPDHQSVVAWADLAATQPELAGVLLLVGNVGTGKTHQAYGALRRATHTRPAPWQATTEPDLMAALMPGGSPDPEATYQRYANAPLLLLDDLGTAKRSDFTRQVLLRLFDHRYAACLPTIITTNLATGSDNPNTPLIADHVGERTASRLVQISSIVLLTGDDRRYGGHS